MTLLAVAAAVSLALVLGALWALYGRLGDRTEGFVLAAGGGALMFSAVLGVNNHGSYGRWAFAGFADIYVMQSDFEAKVEAAFKQMFEIAAGGGNTQSEHENSVHYTSVHLSIRR